MAFIADLKDLRAEVALQNHPLYRRQRSNVVDLVARLQQAQEPAAYADLQRRLLELTVDCQRVEDELRDRRGEQRKRIAEVARREPKPIDELRSLQEELRAIGISQDATKALHGTFRTIGDGMAWRALNYDRRAISALGARARVGRLSEGSGLDAELGELAAREDEGDFAILNDLTNCLLHGDVTIVRRLRGRREVGIVEVKVGGEAAQDPRQTRRLEDVIGLLHTGSHPTAADGEPLVVRYAPIPYRTFLGDLRQLVVQARRDGYASGRPSACMALEVLDEAAVTASSKTLDHLVEPFRRRVGWWQGEPDYVRFSSAARRLRDRRHSFSSLAPVSILPLEAEDVADLLMGSLDFLVTLHLGTLERLFAQTGIAAKTARAQEAGERFLTAETATAGVIVPAQLREQILIELMTPATLIRFVKWMLEQAGKDTEPMRHAMALMDREAEVWESQS